MNAKPEARSQHTPGPWSVFHYIDPTGLRLGIDGGDERRTGIVMYGTCDDDAGVHGVTPDVAEANANLIAAAPDLLEVALAYERWEADLLLDSKAWESGLPVFTQELYDSWMKLQAMRNAAKYKALGEVK